MGPDANAWRGPDLVWAALRLDERLAALGTGRTAERTNERRSWRVRRRRDIALTRQPAPAPGADWAARCASAFHSASYEAGHGRLNAILPLAAQPRARVRDAIDDLAGKCAVDAGPLTIALEGALWQRLDEALAYTLALEMGAASKMGLLDGETPDQRADFFANALGDPRLSGALLGQYPVLLRRLETLVRHWEAATVELLDRLNSDLVGLRDLIGDDPGSIVGFTPLGDSHVRGRCVARLTFASGVQVIYKPRPCAAEAVWERLIAQLNDAGASPDLRAAHTLDCGDYGWVEALVRAPCSSREDVARYFRRLGAQVAIAHVLGLEDVHAENVVPAGEYPVIVDAEALFAALPKPDLAPGATREVASRIRDSVWRSLMVPWPGQDDGPSDLTVLGCTDELDRATPTFNGVAMKPGDHLDEIVAGLETSYALLAREAHALLALQGALGDARARNCRTRRLLRATDDYAQILRNSWHPRYNRDAIAFEAFVRGALRRFGDPTLSGATPENDEVDAIFDGDIPCFAGRPDAREIAAGLGRAPAWTSARTGWEEMSGRLIALSPAQIERQASLVRLSLGARAPLGAEDEDALSLAIRIGDRLAETAVRDEGGANWTTLVSGPRGFIPGVCGVSLYDGLPGIALFLAALAARTGASKYAELAAEAMSEALARHRLAQEPPGGAFTGIGSLAFGLATSADFVDRTDWRIEARDLILANAEAAARQKDVDLIAGSAGFLAAGLTVAPGDAELVATLRPCAERLLSLTERSLPRLADAGLGHGRAGVGLALRRWSRASGDRLGEVAAQRHIAADADRLGAAGALSWCRGSQGLLAVHGAETRCVVADAASTGKLCLCHGAAGLITLTGASGATGSGARKKLCEAFRRRVAAGELSDAGFTVQTPGLMLGLSGIGWALLELDAPGALPNILALESGRPAQDLFARLTA